MKVNFLFATPKSRLLFALFIFAAGLFQSCQNSNSSSNTTASNTTSSAGEQYDPTIRPAKLSVRPPLASVDVAPTRQTIQPEQASTLRMESGTELEIPAHIFVDEHNQPVTAPVEIQFREFHECGQIIASGIPMHIRTGNGDQEYFKTAGMFELNGVSEGKPVKIAPGKSIHVNLASQVDGAYDFWKFDPVMGNWDRIEQNTSAASATDSINPGLINKAPNKILAATKPTQPVEYDQAKPRLNFNINVSRYPHLRKYKNIIWLYAGKDASKAPENNPWIGRINWQEFKLDSLGPQLFQLTLTSENQSYSIPIMPSFLGDDLKKAMNEYNREVTSYKEAKEFMKGKETYDRQSAVFRRSMEVQGFGLYNYDILWKKPDAIPLVADFDFGNMPQAVKQLVTVYLITEHGKTIAALPFYDWSKFRFSPSADNKIVALLPGNQVAVFSQADFNAELERMKKARDSRYVFKMKILDAAVSSVGDLNTIIAKAG
ncbi:MAG: hypothetical protein WCR52_11085 [Bacteroidota bacterium]